MSCLQYHRLCRRHCQRCPCTWRGGKPHKSCCCRCSLRYTRTLLPGTIECQCWDLFFAILKEYGGAKLSGCLPLTAAGSLFCKRRTGRRRSSSCSGLRRRSAGRRLGCWRRSSSCSGLRRRSAGRRLALTLCGAPRLRARPRWACRACPCSRPVLVRSGLALQARPPVSPQRRVACQTLAVCPFVAPSLRGRPRWAW